MQKKAKKATAPASNNDTRFKRKERPRVHRGGPARYTARASLVGRAPDVDDLDAELEKLVLDWAAKPAKTRNDYLNYSTKALLADAEKMLEGEEDLEAFAAIQAPVEHRDFIWLGRLTTGLHAVDQDLARVKDEQNQLIREATFASEGLKTARTQLSRLAQACGVSVSLLALHRYVAQPAALLRNAEIVCATARTMLSQFHVPAVALQRIGELEDATAVLRDIVTALHDTRLQEARIGSRRAALRRFTYDVLTFIKPWGLAAIGDHDWKAHRYRLDNLFPKKATPTTELVVDTPEPTPEG